MEELVKLEPANQYVKPKDVLKYLEHSLEKSLLGYVYDIENMLLTKMEAFLREGGQDAYIEHISFHIEVIGRTFKLVPTNFFTYLVSEGVDVSYKKVENVYKLVTQEGEYIFNMGKREGIFLPACAKEIN